MAQDGLGNEVTTANPATLAGIDDFVSGFLSYEKKATNILAAADADPESVIANVYAGHTWMFLEAVGARRRAAHYLRRAQAIAAAANPREAMLLSQLESWIAGDIPAVQAIGEQIVAHWPTDLASVKLHQYFSFNRGDADAMLRIAETALPANTDNPHLYGMLAFGYEQMHRLKEAEAAARRALSIKSKEPWAQHALAHVMLSSGRTREGCEFLGKAASTWVDLNSFMYTHNWWHKALFHISLGDDTAVFDAYDNHVWGIEPDYSQDQVGAVSLLARMEVAGLEIGNRWEDVAERMKIRARDTLQPFLTLQYLYGLARAERAEAETLMAAIEEKAATTTAFDHLVWHDVALPAARGMLAHARSDYAGAARWLGIANPRLTEIGGSHAQRDLFGQLLLDAHMKIGNWRVAHHLLEMRRIWDPEGVPLGRMLAEANAHLSESGSVSEVRPGRRNLITDVDGLRVGNAEDHRIKTGVTVLTSNKPFVAAVDVMGGSPGTRETDLLDPSRWVTEIDALVLAGGSAFGLDAPSGVSDALRGLGRGFHAAGAVIPVVPGAILFDLSNGGDKGWQENPYRALGRAAFEAAGEDFAIGSTGAGTGAMTITLKGGLGSASLLLASGHTVGALVAANPRGNVTVGDTMHFWAAPFEFGDEFGGLGPFAGRLPYDELAREERQVRGPMTNTTLAIVATDAVLDKAQLKRIAVQAQDGMARAISPSHSIFDGDLIFSVATGGKSMADPLYDLVHIGHAAAVCLSRAIARAIYAATTAPDDLQPTWREKFGRPPGA